MDLVRRFSSEAYVQALSSWTWLEGLERSKPVLANAFGDVFLQAPDGSFSFLDTVEGSLVPTWPDAASLQAAVNTREAQEQYLLSHLVHAAAEAGMDPGPDQVLSFTVPPVLGGELSVENIEPADFVVSVNIAGQVHEQVRSLPPGTPVTDVRIR
jgi:type VI secretion system (T6SS) immunity protein Tdi1